MAGCCGEEFDPERPKTKEAGVISNEETASKVNYTPYIIGLTVAAVVAVLALNIL
ncbi:hypothetical protein [Calorimonas adulescens]|uniref:hypothetical protein n=1 Tax=Calorimonas adulescens TaxID=2606906 RepID=UPI0013968D60|nr:hypothetical protein [Calorimonas adulescens]